MLFERIRMEKYLHANVRNLNACRRKALGKLACPPGSRVSITADQDLIKTYDHCRHLTREWMPTVTFLIEVKSQMLLLHVGVFSSRGITVQRRSQYPLIF